MLIKRTLFIICSIGLIAPTASFAQSGSVARPMFDKCFPFCDRALDLPGIHDVEPWLLPDLENRLQLKIDRLKIDRPDIYPEADEESMASFQTTSRQSSTSASSGTHTINGQTIHYDLLGKSQASSQVRTENGVLTLIAQVDQQQHTVTVHPDKIIHNGRSVSIGGFRDVDIVIEYERVAIAVDGQQVLP